MAFCEPCLSQDLVPLEFHGNMLTTQKTMEEWKQVFVDYAGITVPNAREQPTQYIFPDPNHLALKTPKNLPQEHQSDRLLIIPIELEDIVNQDEETLTRDQCWWKEENEDESLLPQSLLVFLRNLHGFLLRYDHRLQDPFENLGHRLETASEDLHRLKQHCEGLQQSLGRPLTLMGSDFPDVWSALEFLAADPRANEDTTDFRQHLRELHQTIRDIEFNQVQQQATVQKIGWEIQQSQRAAKDKPSDPWLQHLSPQPLMTGVPVVTPPSTPSNATVDCEARLRT
jgi:hypothetical protein